MTVHGTNRAETAMEGVAKTMGAATANESRAHTTIAVVTRIVNDDGRIMVEEVTVRMTWNTAGTLGGTVIIVITTETID